MSAPSLLARVSSSGCTPVSLRRANVSPRGRSTPGGEDGSAELLVLAVRLAGLLVRLRLQGQLRKGCSAVRDWGCRNWCRAWPSWTCPIPSRRRESCPN